jgi:transposase
MTDQKRSESESPIGEPEFAAFVAIDWADRIHYVSLQPAGSTDTERVQVENTPEAVEAWVAQLSQRFALLPIAVAVEQRRGALVNMLNKYGQLHVFPVHPVTLAKYRQAWYPSRSKSDVKDADLILELLLHHRRRLGRLDPDTPEMRLLQFQVENRRKLVEQLTQAKNRLTGLLKLYFPQILEWFDDSASVLVGDLLRKWPTLEALQKAKPATLGKFLRQHRCRSEEKIDQRLQRIPNAVPATCDPAVIRSASCMVAIAIEQIALLRKSIGELEAEIDQLAQRQPDWPIFDSLPGAGKALAPRLLACLGTQRSRFSSANQLQCFAGIAPVKEASGNTQLVHMRWACPKFQRQTFHEWAACSIPLSSWAKSYYQDLRSRGKSHHTAVRALAFKWMRILFRCWQDRQPYREDLYLAHLARRRSAPLHRLAKSVGIP